MYELPLLKILGIYYYFLKKLIILFNKDARNLSNMTIKTSMLQKILISNKCCSFERSTTLKKVYHSFHKNIKQHNCFQH